MYSKDEIKKDILYANNALLSEDRIAYSLLAIAKLMSNDSVFR